MPPQQLPPQKKQGDVKQDDQRAHRDLGQKEIRDLGKAGDPAEGNAVGHEEGVKGQGVYRRAHQNEQIIFCQLGRGPLHGTSSSK